MGYPKKRKSPFTTLLSQELEAITSAKSEEIAKINAETERLNATVAQRNGPCKYWLCHRCHSRRLVLFVLFINLK
jgi:hypothetical protein